MAGRSSACDAMTRAPADFLNRKIVTHPSKQAQPPTISAIGFTDFSVDIILHSLDDARAFHRRRA
jgi:hypothetical protein